MMSKKIVLLVVLILGSCTAFADNALPDDVQQGAKEYDWQACLNAKLGDCMNSCETSEDVDCQDNCNQMASDKCRSEGLNPPS